ncbi:MAG: DUF4347 domain-containing protein [Archangium sp.]|nr:DUF4347 domain-containing protein [Archangium sp.]
MKKRLHLIIVSYPSQLDAMLEEIAHTLARGANEDRVVERAQEASHVRFLIRLWHLRDREIHTVDLVGHGGGGRFQLGDELLFASDGTGLQLIDEWRPFLSEQATLRLLGCSVAERERSLSDARIYDGPKLLRQLHARLGARRRVLAPTRALSPLDYGPRGLSPAARRSLSGSPTPRRKHGRSSQQNVR